MNIKPFSLEQYFAKHEFSIQYLMSASDCEGLYISDLLKIASPQSMGLWQDLKLNYTESQGHPLLLQRIAELYTGFSPADILVAAPEELIFTAMHNLVNHGDHVIVVTPTYQSLHSIVESIGCEVSAWPIELVNGEWSIDIGQLESMIKPTTRLLVINFPNNPTGFVPTRMDLNKIIEIARRKGLVIFSDEMYRLLEVRSSETLPSVSEIYENGISLSGLSKSYALPGLRIGWLATRKSETLTKILNFKYYTTICNSAPSEILAIMALENSASILERNIAIVRDNIQQSHLRFAEIPNFVQWIPPVAGSIAFPAWVGNQPLDDVCEELIRAKGLMLVPGSYFGHANDHFRVGLGRINYPQSLDIFISHLSSSKAR